MCSSKSFGNSTAQGKPKTGETAWFHWAARTFRQWEADEEDAWFRYLPDLPNLAVACSRLVLGLGGLVARGSEGRFVVGVSVLARLARCSRSVMYKELRAFDEDPTRDRDHPNPALYPWKRGNWGTGKQAQWEVCRIMALDGEVARFYLSAPIQNEQVELDEPVQIGEVAGQTCSKRDVKRPLRSSQKTSSSSKTTPTTKTVGVVVVPEEETPQEVETLLTEGMQRLVDRLGTLPEAIRQNPGGARSAVSKLQPEEVECLLSMGDEFWEGQAKEILSRPLKTTASGVMNARISMPHHRVDLLRCAKRWVADRESAVLAGRVAPEMMTLREAFALWRAESTRIPAESAAGYQAQHDRAREAWSAVQGAVQTHFPTEYQSVEAEVVQILRKAGMSESSLVWKRGFSMHMKTRILAMVPGLIPEAS